MPTSDLSTTAPAGRAVTAIAATANAANIANTNDKMRILNVYALVTCDDILVLKGLGERPAANNYRRPNCRRSFGSGPTPLFPLL